MLANPHLGGNLPVFSGYGVGDFLTKSLRALAPHLERGAVGAIKALSSASPTDDLGSKLKSAAVAGVKAGVCGSGLKGARTRKAIRPQI